MRPLRPACPMKQKAFDRSTIFSLTGATDALVLEAKF